MKKLHYLSLSLTKIVNLFCLVSIIGLPVVSIFPKAVFHLLMEKVAVTQLCFISSP